MKRTITRLFDSRAQAERAVRELEDAGIDTDDISFMARSETVTGESRSFVDSDGEAGSETAEGAGQGAAAGAVLGGVGGLLAGLGLIAIPGIGPVVAAGWLAATVAGAAGGAVVGGAAGGILGALKDAGVPDDEAHVYAEGVRRGGSLVSVRVDEAHAGRVEAILNDASGIDAVSRGAIYRGEGWNRFDESARI